MASAPMIVFDSIAHSNIPRREKTAIARWADQVTNGRASRYFDGLAEGGGVGHMAHRIDSGFSMLRQGTEGVAVGGLLGLIDKKFGGLDVQDIPLDLVLAGLTALGGVALAHRESGQDMRNVSSSALTVFAFRKTQELLAEKSRTSSIAGDPTDMGAENGEDPIIAAARGL